MKTSKRFACGVLPVVVVLLLTLMGQEGVMAAEDKEQELIAVLRSDAPPQDKAITCKRLAIYGTKDAVPALAALLPDKDLSSWARIALEVIPDPAADQALREAMDKVEGRLLVGVINSIGVRRDAQAVNRLITRLGDADAAVAGAAAVALGRIGGMPAAKALAQALDKAPQKVRSDVAEGCILCAEGLAAKGESAEAVRLYDAVRQADVPQQRRLEALRGAILARKADGLPLLLEHLKSADWDQCAIALAAARELGGPEVTTALAAELGRLSPERQPLAVLAIADRADAAVLPVIVQITGRRGAPVASRIVAAQALERLGDVSCVPVLVSAAAEDDAALSEAAKVSLLRLSDPKVNAAMVARLEKATGRERQVLIELAEARRIDQALPAIVRSMQDANAGVRGAAVQAVGELGGKDQVAGLVRLLLSTSNQAERENIAKALRKVSARGRADSVPHLLPLVESQDKALRVIGLQALVVAGGPQALAAVRSALEDRDAGIQDEAVRVLSGWPNSWPQDAEAGEALLALARSDRKMTHRLLGLRGYLQYVRGDDRLSAQDKVTKVRAVLPLIDRREEKRVAIAVLGTIPADDAMRLLEEMVNDAAVTEEACSALLSLASDNTGGITKEQRREAVAMVLEKSKNDTTKKMARDLLEKMQ